MNNNDRFMRTLDAEYSRRVCSKLLPSVRSFASKPNAWWSTRAVYSRLSENIVKSYLIGRLKDIRLKGREEAKKAIIKRISGKKQAKIGIFKEYVDKNLPAWSDFLYRIASVYDSEALVGFFVPFIYGGVLTRKNPSGEMISAISFSSRGVEISRKERILRAINIINEQKRLGITCFILMGAHNEVYSSEILSTVVSSPDRAFILIETEDNEKTAVSGESAYKREALSALSRAKNAFVVIDGNGETEMTLRRSKALSSYGILHGIYGEKIHNEKGIEVKNGSNIAYFDQNCSISEEINTFLALLNDFLMLSDRTDVLAKLPSRVDEFIRSPQLPVLLPDLFEILSVLQFVVSAGRIDHIRTQMV